MFIAMFSMSLMTALSLMLFDKKIHDRFMTRWIIKSEEEQKRKSTVNDRKCYVCTYEMPPQAHAHPMSKYSQ